jgi:hypothetical protein
MQENSETDDHNEIDNRVIAMLAFHEIPIRQPLEVGIEHHHQQQ